MSYPLPLTRTEAYLAYKAGVIQQSELKPSLSVPRIGINDWLAYWTGLKNDYPKNPDGTPKMLQEEEKYIAYLCGVTDTYPENCYRRVGAYLRYLISARWGRPDHPLNREELYLSLIKTQFIPSGDPSSDIVIDGTTKAPFVDVKLYGDTYQQTYTGKNLCGGTLAQLKNRNTGGTWNGNQYFQSGITWTVYENADGTIDRIEASGQATENGKTFYISRFDRQQFEEQLGSEETYTLSGCPQGGDSGYYVRVASIPWKTMLTDRGSAATGTLVPADGYTAVFVVLCVDIPAGQVNNLVFRPQLELGSIATTYEPYVGGVPSPNPDYPQPIQTVTGEQTVEIVGKNLFDKDNMDIRNGYLYSTTFSYRTTNADRTFIVPCEPNTTYTISRSVITSSFRAAYIDLEPSEIPADASSETSLTCAGYIANNSGTSITITTSATAKSLLVHYGNTNTDGVTLIDQSVATIMVEKSASATTYAPYSKQTLPIDLGTIELCKLGTYQDYIWKDGEDWKVHKAIGKCIFTGEEDWTWDNARIPRLYLSSGILANLGIHAGIPPNANTLPIGKTNRFSAKTFQSFYTDSEGDGFAMSTAGQNFQIGDNSWSSELSAKADVAGLEWIYALAAGYATDVAITNQTLIDQLEALVAGGAENGTTYIKVNATDPNLPGLLVVEAPKYE